MKVAMIQRMQRSVTIKVQGVVRLWWGCSGGSGGAVVGVVVGLW